MNLIYGAVVFKSSIEKKLTKISDEAFSIEQEVKILEEQLLHFREICEDSRIRNLVSETHGSQLEYNDSIKSLRVIEKDLADKKAKLSKLSAKQNTLLDELSRNM